MTNQTLTAKAGDRVAFKADHLGETHEGEASIQRVTRTLSGRPAYWVDDPIGVLIEGEITAILEVA